jgi:hypothetical protein
MSRLLCRRSVTVRNSESGVTSRRLDLAMIFALPESGLGVNSADYGQFSKASIAERVNSSQLPRRLRPLLQHMRPLPNGQPDAWPMVDRRGEDLPRLV